MENRTKNIERLLSWSKMIDKNPSDFNKKIYNRILSKLKLEKIEGLSDDELLAYDIIQYIHLKRKVREDYYKIKDTHRKYSLPRQMAMTIIKNNTKLSLVEIGVIFGGRDHATVLHSLKKIDDLMYSDKQINNDFMDYLKERDYVYIPYLSNK